MLRSESPASKRPVLWINTIGLAPPPHKPAAMANASPSRHTGTTLGNRPAEDSRASRSVWKTGPVCVSGKPTTWVTPPSASAWMKASVFTGLAI